MVYYYQIKNKSLTQKMLLGETCPVCNKKDTLQLTLNMKYVSSIVPVFGMGRTTSIYCTACNHIVSETDSAYAKNYSENIKNEIKKLPKTYKPAICSYCILGQAFCYSLDLLLLVLRRHT